MSENDKTVSIDSLKADHADIYNKIFELGLADGREVGEKKVRDLFTEAVKLCDGDNDLAVKCFTENKSAVDIMQAKITKLAEQLKTAQEKKPGENKLPDSASSEFSDDANKVIRKGKLDGEGDDSEPKTFMEAVKARMEAEKCTEVEATRFCADKYPKLHEELRRGAKQ